MTTVKTKYTYILIAPTIYDYEVWLISDRIALDCKTYIQMCVTLSSPLQQLFSDPAARDPETPIIVLSQGREPPNFTGFFPHWKQTMWKVRPTSMWLFYKLQKNLY